MVRQKIYTLLSLFLLLQSIHAQYSKTYTVKTGNDDVELNINSTSINFTSSDLELPGKDGSTLQDCYVRFQNITLPSDAVITSAYLEFYAKSTSSGSTQLSVYGEIGSSAVYQNPASTVSGRIYSSQFVKWDTPNSVKSREKYISPDIKGLLGEMFQNGINGSNIGFKIVGNKSGTFTAYSYNGGSAYAPALIINYSSKQEVVSVKGISLSPTSTTMYPNAVQQLSASVVPEFASNKVIYWSSSNDKIATVSTIGLVKAVAAGTATITAKTAEGNYTATCRITVGAAPKIVYGPYLQMGGENSLVIRWRTDKACDSKIMLGSSFNNYDGKEYYNSNFVTDHEIAITNLTPDTKYYYSVEALGLILDRSENAYFKTAPKTDTKLNKKIRVAAFGDCGTGSSNQTGALNGYLNYIKGQHTDAWLIVGDNAYNSGTDSEFQNNFFKMYQSTILKNTYLYAIPGNHDYANSSTRQTDHAIPYLNLFTFPTNGELGGVPSANKEYYSFNYGNIHFVALDSYGNDFGTKNRIYDSSSEQLDWLKKDLSENTLPWVVVFLHHPPYTRGTHSSESSSELIQIREKLTGIFEYYGVDMVISGHSHNYERSYALRNHRGKQATFNMQSHTAQGGSTGRNDGSANSAPYQFPVGKYNHGTVYVVAGSAGQVGGSTRHSAMVTNNSTQTGIFMFEIDNSELNAKFIKRDGTVADQFTIIKKEAIEPVEITNEYIVLNADDDAANRIPANSIDYSSSTLYLQGINGSQQQDNYLRFENVYIPADAVIKEAYLTFTTTASSTKPTVVTISGEVKSSALYKNSQVWNRTYTKNNVSWTTPSSVVSGGVYSTANLKDVVSEMIASGSFETHLGFKLSGNKTGTFNARSFNGSSQNAPRLTIKYTTNGVTEYKAMPKLLVEEFDQQDDQELVIEPTQVSFASAEIQKTVDVITKTAVDLYPNPAIDQVTLSISNIDSKEANVFIYNYSGQKMKSIKYPITSNLEHKQTIDLRGLDSGVYLLKIQLNDQVIDKKLIIK